MENLWISLWITYCQPITIDTTQPVTTSHPNTNKRSLLFFRIFNSNHPCHACFIAGFLRLSWSFIAAQVMQLACVDWDAGLYQPCRTSQLAGRPPQGGGCLAGAKEIARAKIYAFPNGRSPRSNRLPRHHRTYSTASKTAFAVQTRIFRF